MKIRTKLLCLALSCVILATHGQEFGIKHVELTAEKVVLHYDLIDTTKMRTYTVFVYSSIDNFLVPLAKTSGDIGLQVVPGINKRIEWNAREELGNEFHGGVALEIRGRAYIPFINLIGFETVFSQKRNTEFIIKWTGGNLKNVLSFQLNNHRGEMVHAFPNIPNENEVKMTIPTKVKSGKGYYFRVSDARNNDQVVISPPFRIKRKIPLSVKAAAFLAGCALSYYLIEKLDTTPELGMPPQVPDNKN